MLEGNTLARKMYSHSNKVHWASPNPPPKTESNGIRNNIAISLRQKFKKSVDNLEREKKYERFIDNIIMQHVKEERIPILTKNLSKKHNYKSIRIMKTEQFEPNPELQTHRSQQLFPAPPVQEKQPRDRSDSLEASKSTEKKLELPLIFRFKKSELSEGEAKQRTQRSQNESDREITLRELKQKMILKYIRSQP